MVVLELTYSVYSGKLRRSMFFVLLGFIALMASKLVGRWLTVFVCKLFLCVLFGVALCKYVS